jgi:hypothetical protein
MREGQAQVYGTQIVMNAGIASLYPVVDPHHLDERREAIGLPPIEQYLREAEAAMGLSIDRATLQKH